MDMSSIAIEGIVHILLSITFIGLSWWALQIVRWDRILSKPNSAQAKLLIIFISIIFGLFLTEFFVSYFNWSSLIKYLF